MLNSNTKVLRISKLLLSIHQKLCNYSQTIIWYGKKGSEIGVDRKVGRGVQKVEEEIYKRTGISSTRLDKKIRMKVDILDYTTEGVLFIEYENRK